MLSFLRTSLQGKIMIILILLSVLPLTIVGILAYGYISKTSEKEYIENSYKYLKQISKNIDNQLNNIDLLSLSVYTDKNVLEVLRMENSGSKEIVLDKSNIMERFLNGLSMLRKEIIGAYIITDSNIYYQYLYTYGVNWDYKYEDDEWYLETLRKKGAANFIGTHKPYQIDNSRNYCFSVSRRINDPINDDELGVILIDVNYEVFNDLCGSYDESLESRIIITDERGLIIYSEDKNKLTKEIGQKDFLLAETSGNTVVELDNGTYYVNFITSDYLNWKIIHYIPEELVLRAGRMFELILLFALLNLTILSIIISFFISKRISMPVIDLNQVLKKIGQGDFSSRISSDRNDEIGQLTNGVNEMSLNLEGLISELSEAHLKQKEAEINSLQSQINPHFLFNTLNSIQMKARIDKQDKIFEMLEILGMVFKLTINKDNGIIKIKKELEHVNSYVQLQKMRFGGKIQYAVDVDERILELYSLKLILQPVVENSIYHGVNKDKSDGKINIIGYIEDRDVLIKVGDNGVGMSEKKLKSVITNLSGTEKNVSEKTSIGLRNVHERLILYFGEKYGLYVESVFGKGTIVTIRFPVIDDKNRYHKFHLKRN